MAPLNESVRMQSIAKSAFSQNLSFAFGNAQVDFKLLSKALGIVSHRLSFMPRWIRTDRLSKC